MASEPEFVFVNDGAQPASSVFERLLAFLGEARSSLDLAIYDAHLPQEWGERLILALDAAEARGVTVRAVYNDVAPRGAQSEGGAQRSESGERSPLSTHSTHSTHSTQSPVASEASRSASRMHSMAPSLLSLLAAAVPATAIPGVPDLMHHKYVIRDRDTVWTGSANWTEDAWSRMENVLVIVPSPDLAAAYQLDFDHLWEKRRVLGSGAFDDQPARMQYRSEPFSVRAVFSPGRGRALGQLVARRIQRATTRIRICSPVITSGPVLSTLAEVLDDKQCDAMITIDGPQMNQAVEQWKRDGRASWKVPLVERMRASGCVNEKHSKPYGAGAPYDYMHAKVVVCDNTVLTGSYNLSHSGEMNAENVLEIVSVPAADECAAFCEAVHARYRK